MKNRVRSCNHAHLVSGYEVMAPKTAGSTLCTVSGRVKWLEAKEFEVLDFKT